MCRFMGLNARKGQKNSGKAPAGNARKVNPSKAAGIMKKLARVRKQLEASNSLVKKKRNKEHPLQSMHDAEIAWEIVHPSEVTWGTLANGKIRILDSGRKGGGKGLWTGRSASFPPDNESKREGMSIEDIRNNPSTICKYDGALSCTSMTTAHGVRLRGLDDVVDGQGLAKELVKKGSDWVPTEEHVVHAHMGMGALANSCKPYGKHPGRKPNCRLVFVKCLPGSCKNKYRNVKKHAMTRLRKEQALTMLFLIACGDHVVGPNEELFWDYAPK